MVKIAPVLLPLSSKPMPLSISRWRMPENKCWKNAQVRPIRTTSPAQCDVQPLSVE